MVEPMPDLCSLARDFGGSLIIPDELLFSLSISSLPSAMLVRCANALVVSDSGS